MFDIKNIENDGGVSSQTPDLMPRKKKIVHHHSWQKLDGTTVDENKIICHLKQRFSFISELMVTVITCHRILKSFQWFPP